MWSWVARLPRLFRRLRAERGETSYVQLLEVAISIRDSSPCATTTFYNGDNGFLLSVYFIICHAPRPFHPKDSMSPDIRAFDRPFTTSFDPLQSV
jgi:hypothetical protein